MEVPHNIENHRAELCRSCKTPCEFQNVPSFRREGDNACPINRFQAYKTYTKKGLGDLVAMVAQPIAGAIDAIAGTNVRKCGACMKRRDALNQMFPFN